MLHAMYYGWGEAYCLKCFKNRALQLQLDLCFCAAPLSWNTESSGMLASQGPQQRAVALQPPFFQGLWSSLPPKCGGNRVGPMSVNHYSILSTPSTPQETGGPLPLLEPGDQVQRGIRRVGLEIINASSGGLQESSVSWSPLHSLHMLRGKSRAWWDAGGPRGLLLHYRVYICDRKGFILKCL